MTATAKEKRPRKTAAKRPEAANPKPLRKNGLPPGLSFSPESVRANKRFRALPLAERKRILNESQKKFASMLGDFSVAEYRALRDRTTD